jgi:hypothetical protein
MSSFAVSPTGDAGHARLAGCDVIYSPAGQAGEYSPVALNIYRGCGHGCKYCYGPATIHLKWDVFNAGALPRKDLLKRVRHDAEKCQAAGLTDQILLCFTTDPYNPGNTNLTRQTMEILREHNLGFCALTQGAQERCETSTWSALTATHSPRRSPASTMRHRCIESRMLHFRQTVSQRSRPSTTLVFSPGSASSLRSMQKQVWPS